MALSPITVFFREVRNLLQVERRPVLHWSALTASSHHASRPPLSHCFFLSFFPIVSLAQSRVSFSST